MWLRCVHVCMFMFMQALLANMASLYGVYHGPEGLTRIADRYAPLLPWSCVCMYAASDRAQFSGFCSVSDLLAIKAYKTRTQLHAVSSSCS